ncbi:VWA domain-containing protein [Enterobacteriaceae bacterium BIT-l23]|uniref:VWA domain-containing protein n=1 Tax=Jejubacter sp. L23 TaxID=3092086 RepID=UPI0015858F6C|nr:VWA domain-containing protein [Enterobacteriaceae bacterium BIT-l23]
MFSDWLTHLTFAWPLAWGLLALPLVWRFLPSRRPQNDQSVRMPHLPMLQDRLALDAHSETQDRTSQLLFWVVWTLLVCALARPEYIEPPEYITQPMRDVVLILDVSGSMAQRDVTDARHQLISRLQAVQSSSAAFIHQRRHDRLGLVIFSARAWPWAPLSEDRQALLARLNTLKPGMAGQQTAIGDAIGVTTRLLSQADNASHQKMAILLTDGRDSASQIPPDMAVTLAARHGIQIHTIAFGDLNQSGDDRPDSALLKRIAQATGGQFHAAAASGPALEAVWRDIDRATPTLVRKQGWSWHRPLFHWPMAAGLLVLLCTRLSRTLLQRIPQ